ncbi:1,4-dihydroxy-2-naphthoate octaprenyltransferase [Sabulilitoribacter multivorans]|uniref:1,4-dihydroxy-2-naphthoate octaprenyltransferase n=1 Tax=Flaviramulus multivorans TaxID=1304750 RepID=A0ABS9IIS0_9FLAO|nr:1,4-dihydroxy-2-naphthoate octaprenyltransferase [Flaviramulus multivorans]MCF7560077.1 1,4-dihydroxy-2-naphthoate octaprenyltransferase [Flaviramulus multivorans]
MKKVSIWISAIRLRTLPLSISGIILASCLAVYNGVFEWRICILAILTTLSFQILSNLANDYGDGVKGTDNANRIGPERVIQSGKISPEELFNAIKINVLISIVLASLLIFIAFGVKYFSLALVFFLLGLASIVAAVRYTIGKKAYGYRGLGDIFVFIFFGLVSVIGCYVLFAKRIDHVVFLPAFTIGLLSAAVLNLNNMRDRLSDTKSNKITFAVLLGEKKVKLYHNVLILLAIGLSSLFGILYYTSPYNLIFVIAYIPLLVHLRKVNKNNDLKLLDPELKKLALTTVLLAVLMGIGHLLE